MSTGNFANWDGTITDIGPIYPFVGSEGLMVLICVVFWIGWHILQIRMENKQHDEEAANLRKAGNLLGAGVNPAPVAFPDCVTQSATGPVAHPVLRPTPVTIHRTFHLAQRLIEGTPPAYKSSSALRLSQRTRSGPRRGPE
jgi:hypothetical protein